MYLIYDSSVVDAILQKLIQKECLRAMPDGRLGVPITVQFQGDVPRLPRPERKRWLLRHFTELGKHVSSLPVYLDPDSISVSGQTIDALCAPELLEDLRALVAPNHHRIDVTTTVQAAAA